MCTLTFVPGLPGGGYLLAMNRDESPRRALAVPPTVQTLGSRTVIAPRDPDGGGTWIGVDDHGRCVAILNGDRPLPPGAPRFEEGAPVSRGLLVQGLLGDPRFGSVRDELERRHRLGALNYRPFKLVVVSPGRPEPPGASSPSASLGSAGSTGSDGRAARLLRVDWDGAALRFEEESGPRCVVSSGFDTEGVTRFRSVAFESLLQQHSSAESLTAFHASHHPEAPQGDARSVCMHRDEARTVSSTLIEVGADRISVSYRAGWPCRQPPVQITTMPRVG